MHIIWFCYHLSSESTHWQDWQKCQQIIFGQNATWWLLCKNFTFLFYFIGVLYLTTGKFCVGWFFWENVTEKNLPIVFMREVIHENLVTHVVEYLFIYLIYLLINLSCFLSICLVFFLWNIWLGSSWRSHLEMRNSLDVKSLKPIVQVFTDFNKINDNIS